ncbi:MAG: AraC family transcriptional regulator [Muribaculaceae bacterium]|nr:AraC family transcriptional regulator [Muribaculaceae bacterium]MDE6794406.1 AraC family transcriptional regulator [Muribaculaceae bacterium]
MTHLLSEYADWILIVLIAETLIILIESMVIFRVCKKQQSEKQNQAILAVADFEESSDSLGSQHEDIDEKQSLTNSDGAVTVTSASDVEEVALPVRCDIPVEKQDMAEAITSIDDIIEDDDGIRKTSILLIEDDTAMQQLYLKALENDYIVICQTVPNSTYAPTSEKFDITIISEPLFPYTVKYKEIVKRIKAIDKSDARKIVVLADNITDTQLSNGYKEGIDLFLKKPITPEVLQYNLKSLYADLSIASLPPYRHLSGKPLSNEDRRFIRRLTSLLEEDADNDSGGITIVAQRLAMSHSSLYKKLKSITGLSVIEFSNAHKISLALKKMQEGNDRIHEISNECGFRDVKSFRQSFKTLMGMTPSQYIKTLQDDTSPAKGEAT